MDANGDNTKCLTPESKFCKSPSWSPDGKKIAYCAFKSIGPPKGARIFAPDAIFLMDSNGTNKQYAANGLSPSWSDGQHTAFLANRSGIWIICTTNIDGSDTKEYPTCISPSSCGIRFQAENYPTLTVSPDGRSVLFDNRDFTGRRDIYIMSFGNSEINKLTGNISGSCYCPTWVPDGSKIAFTLESDGNTDIYIMNSDGSNPTLLIKDGMFPSWQRGE
jgi:TolB protein